MTYQTKIFKGAQKYHTPENLFIRQFTRLLSQKGLSWLRICLQNPLINVLHIYGQYSLLMKIQLLVALAILVLTISKIQTQNSQTLINRTINTKILKFDIQYQMLSGDSRQAIISFPPELYSEAQLQTAYCQPSCSVQGLTATFDLPTLTSQTMSFIIYNVDAPLGKQNFEADVSIKNTKGYLINKWIDTINIQQIPELQKCNIQYQLDTFTSKDSLIFSIVSPTKLPQQGNIVLDFPSYLELKNTIINQKINQVNCQILFDGVQPTTCLFEREVGRISIPINNGLQNEVNIRLSGAIIEQIYDKQFTAKVGIFDKDEDLSTQTQSCSYSQPVWLRNLQQVMDSSDPIELVVTLQNPNQYYYNSVEQLQFILSNYTFHLGKKINITFPTGFTSSTSSICNSTNTDNKCTITMVNNIVSLSMDFPDVDGGLFQIIAYNVTSGSVSGGVFQVTGDYSSNMTAFVPTCAQPCQTCDSSEGIVNQTQCVSCYPTSNSYLYNSTCYQSCPTATYPIPTTNNTSNTCGSCSANCTACTDANTCTQCNTTYFILNATCFLPCPSGYFGNTTTATCNTCSTNCSSCTNASVCTACNNGSYLSLSQCVTSCPSTFFGNNATWTCDSCSVNCTTCTDASTCTACTSGSFLQTGSCVTSCSNGTFANSNTNTCDNCQNGCALCSGSASNCSQCNGTYFFYQLSCLNPCPVTFFGQTSNNTCMPCSANCEQCVNSTNCTSCSSNYDLLQNNTCNQTCGPNQFAQTNRDCATCNTTCATCSVTATNCTSCTGSTYLYNFNCTSPCPSTTFANTTTNTCNSCSVNCTTCTNSSACSLCYNNAYLYQSSCVLICPNGFFANNDPTNLTCSPCANSCATCSGAASTCTGCSGNNYLNSSASTCGTTCSSGYFPNTNTNICQVCSTNCTACTNASFCTACANSSLYNNVCVSNCPNTTFLNTANNTCLSCSSNCNSCLNNTNCTLCATNYYLFSYSCTATCPNGTYSHTDAGNGTCDSCDAACALCDKHKDNCTKCNTGFYLNGNTCSSTCPDATYANYTSLTCNQCYANCAICNATATNCSSCLTGYFLFNTTCGTTCPSTTFEISSNNTCGNCSANCNNCLNGNNCTTCLKNFYLMNAACVSSCPSSTFANVSSGACENCDSTCTLCYASSSNCSYCNTGSFLYNWTCGPTCPATTYTNQTNNTCLSCSSNCNNCENNTYCTNCSATYYLYQNACVAQCPNGYFNNNATMACTACDSSCATCYGSSGDCSYCNPNFYLLNSTCGTTCIAGTYKNNQNWTCTLCSSFLCTSCTSGTSCQICADGSYLSNGFCLPCNLSCKTCVSFNNCTDCIDTTTIIQQNNLCVSQCDVGYYRTIDGGCENCPINCAYCTNNSTCLVCQTGYNLNATASTCTACPPLCSCCQNNLTMQGFLGAGSTCGACVTGGNFSNFGCSNCLPGYYQNGTYDCEPCNVAFPNCRYCNAPACTQCQNGFYLSSSNTCQPCMTSCSTCTSQYVCTACSAGTLMQNSTCVNICSPGYYQSGNQCLEALYSVMPFPFTIIAVCFLIFSLISYFANRRTIFYVMDFALNSLIETISVAVLVAYLVTDENINLKQDKSAFILICVGFGLTMLVGFAMVTIGRGKLTSDPMYLRWKVGHHIVSFFCSGLGFILNGRFYLFQFSRAFGAESFSAPMQYRNYFKLVKHLLTFSLIPSVLIIVGCGIQINMMLVKNVRYYTYVFDIDCLIVHCIGVIMVLIYLFLNPEDMLQDISGNPLDSERTNVTQPFQMSSVQSPKVNYPVESVGQGRELDD